MSEEIEDNEIGEIDLESLNEQYEDRGFFRRLRDMSAGLSKPHDSREYKLARIELQRLAAPLIAIVAVVLFVIVLVVVTAISGQKKQVMIVNVQKIEETEPELEEPPEEEPPDVEPPPMEDVEIMVDNPNPGPVSEITPVASPPSTQVSVKPAPTETVRFVDSPVKMKSLAGSRTPGSIGAATSGGAGLGDKRTEACVMKVLWWLKATQSTDGSWQGGLCPLANTGLGVLTYLAHGEYPGSKSPNVRDFGPVVMSAINYLINCVDKNSNPVRMRGVDGNEYAFLIATYALCEAYGMTKNPNCREVAELCLDRIVKGQSPTGGWDYKINPSSTRDDMSFAGWALQALKAGKMAGLHPEGLDACIKKAINCLKTRNFNSGGFNYTALGPPTGLTATGCLAMQLLGYGSQPEVLAALDYMRTWKPSFDSTELVNGARMAGSSPQYYCYYATQCKYQAGMKQGAAKKDETTWQQWNSAMKTTYSSLIIDLPEMVQDATGKGHKQGYFTNNDQHSSRPTMDTCLVALQLMVYYRYLPTTQTSAAAEEGADAGANAAVEKGSDIAVEVDI